jgi:hypothetical protein
MVNNAAGGGMEIANTPLHRALRQGGADNMNRMRSLTSFAIYLIAVHAHFDWAKARNSPYF